MKILLTGAKGFLGTAVHKELIRKGYQVSAIDRDYCDFLQGEENIHSMLSFEKPDAIIHLAGIVGGIMLNKEKPYDLLYQNLAMNTAFLNAAKNARIPRLLYTFCGCSFPSHVKNPIREEDLFTGLPDENSMFYSIGKATNHLQVIAARRQYGLSWSSIIPGNCYGMNDCFDERDSHVIPGMITKFHNAKIRGDASVTLWGNGFPLRDFIFVEDASEGIVLALERHNGEIPINISSGVGISIKDTAEIIKDVVGFKGEICWDASKPGGQICKIFDCERAERILGFKAKTPLKEGIRITYKWFCDNIELGKVMN